MERSYGTIPSLECRHDSNEVVDRQKRYRQIIECLTEFGDMSAREIASAMCLKGYASTAERNVSAPRLTEMCERGIVEQKGKKVCRTTHKIVTVYGLTESKSTDQSNT